MTSADLTVHGQPSTALTIEPDQTSFTPQQVAVLKHLGVDEAGEGDLAVFFHVAKRTGLDPFARQIHMIGRNSKNQRTDKWETKYTIQTGIDGYRLIGHRAARRERITVSIPQVEWAHEDGSWRPLWSPKWGMPLAARATILKDGQPFTAVALFDEYKQTKRDGNLTSMWQQRPAGQIAKCAEALAWRMAFPQDLAGVYVEDEMHAADSAAEQAPVKASGRDRMAAALGTPTPAPTPPEDVQDAEVVESEPPREPITPGQLKALHASLKEAGLGKDEALALYSRLASREVTSSKDLSRDEASWVIDALKAMVPAPAPDAPPAKSQEQIDAEWNLAQDGQP